MVSWLFVLVGICLFWGLLFGLFVVDGYSGGDGPLCYSRGLDKIGVLGTLILGFYVAV